MNTNDNTNDKENDINKGEEPIKIPEIDYSKMFKELTYLILLIPICILNIISFLFLYNYL